MLRYPFGMTPEEFLELPVWKMWYKTVGPLGIALALAGFFGVLCAGEEWAHEASDVLGTAMTPVGVIAAASIILCHGAVIAGERNPNRPASANDVVANMASGYAMATTIYFGFALAALPMASFRLASACYGVLPRTSASS